MAYRNSLHGRLAVRIRNLLHIPGPSDLPGVRQLLDRLPFYDISLLELELERSDDSN